MEYNPVTQIMAWITKAVPSPTDRDIHSQLGDHFDEVANMLGELKGAGASFKAREKITFGEDVMRFLSLQFKTFDEEIILDLEKIDRVKLLNSLCGQMVNSINTSYVTGLDIQGGIKEFADSNDSKFSEDGSPIFNRQSKIMKGPNYKKPNLKNFV
tara:strand:+ start:4173 stop:4640 length:468 start_codon:yes stop_codon:yes gene_type:complete